MPNKYVPRQRKHKVLARQKASEASSDGADNVAADSNALEIIPSKKDTETKKLREELKDQGVKVSGKKAKRLEKYIDNKLKADENRVLLAKLANSKVDTSLFYSTRTLGQGKETKKQTLKRALQEHKAGLRDEEDEELFEQRNDTDSEPEANSTEAVSPPTTNAVAASTQQPVSAGSGLKRPLELGDDGRPVMQKRQKRGGVKSKFSTPKIAEPEPELESSTSSTDEWGGINSDGEAVDGTNSSGDDQSEDEEEDASSAESGSEDEEMSDDDSEDDSGDEPEDTQQRSSAFKAWAHQQRNQALGYDPIDPASAILDIPKPENFKPRPLEQEPLPMELQATSNDARKAYSVPVTRSTEIQEARLKLPVVAEEQKIMEAIHNNNIVVICGATGSGKTTQVPQFLFEAGYGSPDSPTPGLIGVTQPRKVAAVSMSKRVGQELGNHSEKVAYQIRFEGTADEKTAIKFMTDGVLLREVSSDIALRKYSAVIIDEAHERSVNTDILIGMLSRVVKLRQELAEEDPTIKPLKLIIMSATLRIDDLTKNPTLFPIPPPVLDVEGRQFPVTVHFARQTKHDYVEEAYKKITRGHKKLPPGGMLVFLTGHDEISRLSKMLKQATGGWASSAYTKVKISANDAPLEVEDIEFGQTTDATQDDYDEINFIDDAEEEDDDDDKEFDIPDEEAGTGPLKMHILPLFSLLPTKEQMRARRFDKESGVQSYEIGWISKASANQRSGRAGRTGPGHCYRLYSSAVYERDFAEFADPELLRMPIEGIVLQLKAMRLQHVVNFPFPTPPERSSLAKAERLLTYLSAITPEGQATDIGSTMAKFPLPPRFARILLIGHLHDCMPYTIALVAGLSTQEIFIPETVAVPAISDREEGTLRTNEDVIAETQQARVRQKYNKVHQNFRSLDDASDAIKLLQVVGEFAHDSSEQWCENHFVRFKALQEAQKLRKQITSLLQKDIPAFANLTFKDKLDRPTPKQVTALKQMVAAGFIDQVAIRGDLAPNPPEQGRKPRRAIDVPYVPLHPIDPLSDDDVDKCVYIHPASSLAHFSPQECPEYIVYSHLQRAAPGIDAVRKPKTRMLALTDVTSAQLAALAKGTPLLNYGKPIKEVKTDDPAVRESFVVPYLRAEGGGGGQGWALPVKKIVQKKVPGKGWVVQ
ncbi:P-loop containing nucleoside triphosphate hydrolase protein [Truncatella angustata]|uniref:RNA helicase n=1 Tax=Truncatella angustata TaxID=152316 RepID=A0A9P8ZYF6_9PEZI|nr:P-loop containing nucleoside triphosphate hydrolase protein [Truncatella angustata]KAH6654968.1 P-loop containing nucleoside triphosphate hydrolase protein [Truncatella angustata]